MSFPSRTGKTPADVWFERLIIRPIIAAMLLLVIIAMFGCATEPPMLNAKGERLPHDVAVSCIRRANYAIFLYDQLTIDECIEAHGYRKATQ